jgi:cytochrome c oxidase assembly factor CtaG
VVWRDALMRSAVGVVALHFLGYFFVADKEVTKRNQWKQLRIVYTLFSLFINPITSSSGADLLR